MLKMYMSSVIITLLLTEVNLMCKPTLSASQVECNISKIAQQVLERVSAVDYPHQAITNKLLHSSKRDCLDNDLVFTSQILNNPNVYFDLDPELFFMVTQRPSWESAPEWANFLTGSLDGFWSWHEKRPTFNNREMYRPCGRMKSVDTGMKNALWLGKIFERPVLVPE